MSAVISASVTTRAVTVIVPSARILSVKHGWKTASRICFRSHTFMWFLLYLIHSIACFFNTRQIFTTCCLPCTWETIAQFSYTNLHAETGMVAILHTWGQNLSLHPHIHCVVPGGGINFKGQWKQVSTSENGKVFLFRVENLSNVFRGKFIDALQRSCHKRRSLLMICTKPIGLFTPRSHLPGQSR